MSAKRGVGETKPGRRADLAALPPDGGYGWLIVFISTYISLAIDVGTFGFPPIRDHLLDQLHRPLFELSFLTSTYSFLMYALGPVAAGLCNRFGFRLTAALGSVLMTSGFIVAFFVNSYALISIGIGSSMLFLVASVAPGFWFDGKREIAFGLASMGTPFAVFSAIISTLVVENYPWKWCFIFWAVVTGVCFVMAFFLKSPPVVQITYDVQPTTPAGVIDIENISKIVVERRGSVEGPLPSTAPRRRSSTDSHLDKKLKAMSSHRNIPLYTVPSLHPLQASRFRSCFDKYCCCFCRIGRVEIGARPLYKQDIFYQGNIGRVAEMEELIEGDEELNLATYSMHVTRVADHEDIMEELECRCRLPVAFKTPLQNMLEFSLFKSLPFVLLMFAAFFHYLSMMIPFLVIKRTAEGRLNEYYSEWLSPLLGLGTLSSRALSGFVTFILPRIRVLWLIILGASLGGATLASIAFIRSPELFLTAVFFAGFFPVIGVTVDSLILPGVILPMRSVVVIDYLGLEQFTSVTGMLFFVQGIASLIGLPISEYLTEIMNEPFTGLYFSGASYLAAALFYLGLSFIPSIRDQQQQPRVSITTQFSRYRM